MDDSLQKGIDAFNAGKLDEARNLFSLALDQNINDEQVWDWIYKVTRNDAERIRCLKQMLRINPKNKNAKQLLIDLTATQPAVLETAATRPQNPILVAQNSQKVKKSFFRLFSRTMFFVILLGVLIGAGFYYLTSTTRKNDLHVTYVFTGNSGSANIIYSDDTGENVSNSVKLPFTREITIKRGAFVSSSAIPANLLGTVKCEIWLDGVKKVSSTSDGSAVFCIANDQ
jgi:hypothetical protein